MFKIKNKKAITPIIAIILLLMIVIASAAAAFFWFIRIQSELQGTTETYSEDLSEKISSRVDITSINSYTTYNETSGYYLANATLYLQNRGTNDLSLTSSTITTIIKLNENVICSGIANTVAINCTLGCGGILEKNEIEDIVLTFNDSICNLSEKNYKLMLDFNGEVATVKEFEPKLV